MASEKKIVQFVPNALTLLRLPLTAVFLALLVVAGRSPVEKPAALLMTAFGLFLLAAATDVLDGKLARHYGVTSKFGRLVDPLADKALVCGAFLCFAIAGQPRLAHFGWSEKALDAIHWGILGVIAAREVSVTFIRHIAEARGINFGAVWSGKLKMVAQSFGIGTVIVGWAYVSRPWGEWFTIITFALVAVITVMSGIHSFTRPIR